ncbi:MAG TPA: GNAT family N-acetyltransferase [Ilumatobacter sp.]|nr:GNAT family N-acetyltransferase [Ilumatobacter sp.]
MIVPAGTVEVDGQGLRRMTAEVEIRTLDTPDDMASIVEVLQQVWGTRTPIVNVELLRAMAHSGGYVAGAFDHDRLVGASFGFLASHNGEPALHSHVTGILPCLQRTGVGRSVKFHQREWAAARGIAWITWTFDPIVRRNAWFNLEVLGARVSEYVVNFYGSMSDSINAHDESDRLVVAWPTDPARPRPMPPDGATTVHVDTPEDIVLLRRTDQAEAMRWRRHVRDELCERMDAGATVTGFTREGQYVLQVVA